jgi:hypothetical protein
MEGGLSQELGAYLKQYAREIISGGMWICAVISLCAMVPVVYMLTGSLFVRLLFLVVGGACVFWLIRRLYIYYHRRLHGRPPDKSMFRRVALYALLSSSGILLTFGFFGLIVSLLPLSVSQYQPVMVYGSYILSVLLFPAAGSLLCMPVVNINSGTFFNHVKACFHIMIKQYLKLLPVSLVLMGMHIGIFLLVKQTWLMSAISVLLSTLLWVVTWESSLQAYQRRGNRAQA